MGAKFVYWRSEKNNEWYWKLLAANGFSIAVGGEGFTSKQGCLDSIETVRKLATDAAVQEETKAAEPPKEEPKAS